MTSIFRALFNGTSKHRKLSEDWASIREPVVEGVTFYCKYLGSTAVDDPKGEAATADAIKRIIHAAKQNGRKPERVSLHVSLQGIRMADVNTSNPLLETSIYKISYCSADAHYDHVFAFIATNDNDTSECHAFLCTKRKMAHAATISIAQAFNLAYECWKMTVESKDGEIFANEELPAEVKVSQGAHVMAPPIQGIRSQPSSETSSPIPIRSDFGSSEFSTSGYQSSTQALIDLDDTTDTIAKEPTKEDLSTKKMPKNKHWDAFDDFSEFSEGFSGLALRHTDTPQLPGTSPPEWSDWAGIGDLAAFTGHPPASPTGSGSWPWYSSQGSPSSPSNPWSIGQSPPNHWEDFSTSPNSAFLHSCQSPPSHTVFPDKLTGSHLSKVASNPFQPSSDCDAFNPRKSNLSNPFTQSIFDTKAPGTGHSPSCGVSQPVWGAEIFDGRKGSKVVCS